MHLGDADGAPTAKHNNIRAGDEEPSVDLTTSSSTLRKVLLAALVVVIALYLAWLYVPTRFGFRIGVVQRSTRHGCKFSADCIPPRTSSPDNRQGGDSLTTNQRNGGQKTGAPRPTNGKTGGGKFAHPRTVKPRVSPEVRRMMQEAALRRASLWWGVGGDKDGPQPLHWPQFPPTSPLGAPSAADQAIALFRLDMSALIGNSCNRSSPTRVHTGYKLDSRAISGVVDLVQGPVCIGRDGKVYINAAEHVKKMRGDGVSDRVADLFRVGENATAAASTRPLSDGALRVVKGVHGPIHIVSRDALDNGRGAPFPGNNKLVADRNGSTVVSFLTDADHLRIHAITPIPRKILTDPDIDWADDILPHFLFDDTTNLYHTISGTGVHAFLHEHHTDRVMKRLDRILAKAVEGHKNMRPSLDWEVIADNHMDIDRRLWSHVYNGQRPKKGGLVLMPVFGGRHLGRNYYAKDLLAAVVGGREGYTQRLLRLLEYDGEFNKSAAVLPRTRCYCGAVFGELHVARVSGDERALALRAIVNASLDVMNIRRGITPQDAGWTGVPTNPRNVSNSSSSGDLLRVLIIDRKKSRVIDNLGSIVKKLGTELRFPAEVRVAEMERYTLEEQVAMFQTTHVLIGVHGNGLGWTCWLSRRDGTPTLVELGAWTRRLKDYEGMSKDCGVRYHRIDPTGVRFLTKLFPDEGMRLRSKLKKASVPHWIPEFHKQAVTFDVGRVLQAVVDARRALDFRPSS